ncbi:MAG: hypothetical protein LBT82_04210 [Oscillospiraceae bacterium]|nr:hypothetical protein [Oscillospiraceae bacterium]
MKENYSKKKLLCRKSKKFFQKKVANKNNLQKHKAKRSIDSSQTLIIVQSVICLTIIISFLLLKLTSNKAYEKARFWYFEKLNDSVFVEDNDPGSLQDSALLVDEKK